MPTNLYGPNDNFDPASSHVLPALIKKFHDAKKAGQPHVVIWGDGTARREFLPVDDLADACLFLMHHYDSADPINVGTGEDLTIAQLANVIKDEVYPDAELIFDHTKPGGTPRKLLNVGRLNRLGWRHTIELRQGIAMTYDWYVDHEAAH
jgi:GDP-L-fucose synthase